MKQMSILIALFAMLWNAGCRSSEPYGDVFRGKVKRESISIAGKIPGRIIELNVQEGDRVIKGDTLAVIDIPEVDAKLEQARGAVMAAEAQYEMACNGATHEQLEQITAKVSAAEEQLTFAKRSFERLKNMYDDSLISAQQYDEVFMKYQSAQAQYQSAVAQKEEVVKGVRDEKLNMAKGQLHRAKAALQEAEVAASERFIVAPQDLDIRTVSLREGELLLPGYGFISGYLTGEAYFRFSVPESAIHAYREGSECLVEFPMHNKKVRARIQLVRPLPRYADKTTVWPENEIGETTFEVKALPVEEVAGLMNNTSIILRRNGL